MGNPHPTKSKPIKIGRKHTNAQGLRKKGKAMSNKIKSQKQKVIEWKRYNKEVKAYWNNERETFPNKP